VTSWIALLLLLDIQPLFSNVLGRLVFPAWPQKRKPLKQTRRLLAGDGTYYAALASVK